MVFRGIQAAGSAATISIGAGVIGDMATASERGGMIGVFGGSEFLSYINDGPKLTEQYE